MREYIDNYLPIVILYALSFYFLMDTEDFTADALLYPKGLVWILLPLATVLLALTVSRKISVVRGKKEETSRVKFLIIFLTSLLFVVAVPFLGFTISAMIFCFLTPIILGYEKKSTAIVVSVVLVALVYIGFKMFLKVPLPTATFFGITL